jgi:hypothetical protein
MGLDSRLRGNDKGVELVLIYQGSIFVTTPAFYLVIDSWLKLPSITHYFTLNSIN